MPLTQLLGDAGGPYDGALITVSGFLDRETQDLYLTRDYAEVNDLLAVPIVCYASDDLPEILGPKFPGERPLLNRLRSPDQVEG